MSLDASLFSLRSSGKIGVAVLLLIFVTIMVGTFNLSVSLDFKDNIAMKSRESSQRHQVCKGNASLPCFDTFDNSTAVPSLGPSSLPNTDTREPTLAPSRYIVSNATEGPNPFNISIVIQLSGEMGNHLSKLAFGIAIQERLWERHRIHSHFVLKHQERGSKWISAKESIQECFPRWRGMDFSLGNSDEFVALNQKQLDWLGSTDADALVFPNGIDVETIDNKLNTLVNLLNEGLLGLGKQNGTSQISEQGPDLANITLPFLHVQSFVPYELIDLYYKRIRHEFKFDNARCCLETPDPDEHVFHFRNFVHEMPKRGISKGYEELDPNQTASKLFGHLKPGEKLAIITRFDDEATQAYVSALETRGVSTRIVGNQTGPQDFCFLTKARREIAGIARSSFFLWGSLLGECTRAWMYSINSTATRMALGADAISSYHWNTSQDLGRMKFISFRGLQNLNTTGSRSL